MNKSCFFFNTIIYNILKNKNCEYTNLEELFEEESTYIDSEITEVSNFLRKLLVYDHNHRLSSKECYENNWLKI